MSKTKVVIPATIEEATEALGGLGALLTAKEWERAAIVYAFTEVGQHGRGKTVSSDSFSFDQFAALGINGLKSKNTVQMYHQRWVEHGDTDIKPGDTVTLPDAEWPPTRTGTDGYESDEGKAKTIGEIIATPEGRKAAVSAITELPEDEKRGVAEDLALDETIQNAAVSQVHEDYEESKKRAKKGKDEATDPDSAAGRLKNTLDTIAIRMAISDAERATRKVLEASRPEDLGTETKEALLRYAERAHRLGDYLEAVAEAVAPGDMDAALAALLDGE